MTNEHSKQFIEGGNAFMDNKPKSANPYSFTQQPVYYGRWANGWDDCNKIVNNENYTHGLDLLHIGDDTDWLASEGEFQ